MGKLCPSRLSDGSPQTVACERSAFGGVPDQGLVPTVVLDGVRIGFDDTASGSEPAVLFVHGTPFNRSTRHPQLEALERRGRRAVAPDLRDHGEGSVVPRITRFDTFASDLLAFLDHRGLTDPVVVCDLSMGGQIAMEFCRSFHERVAGLALMETKPQAETESGRDDRRSLADRLERDGIEPYAREVLPKMLAPETIERRPEIAEDVMRMMVGTDPSEAAAARRGRAKGPAYEPLLAKLAVPALVVVGDRDPFTSRSDAESMHSLLRSSELVWMRGVGHLPNPENVPEFNAALERLLERSSPPPS
jgi:3-oxoadipate enol-lactonase